MMRRNEETSKWTNCAPAMPRREGMQMGYGSRVSSHGEALQAKATSAVREIGVLLYDGFSLVTASIVPEIFQLANDLYAAQNGGARVYNTTLLSMGGGGVLCSSSIDVWTHACDRYSADAFSALFIAEGPGVDQAMEDQRLIKWLREVVPRSMVTAPIGKGRLLLERAVWPGHASTSLGREEDGKVETSGILIDGFECIEPARTALKVVMRDLGTDLARQVSEQIAVDDDEMFVSSSAEIRADASTDKIVGAARWLRENCGQRISVSDAANIASMSDRNFLRCFKREIGVSPAEYLLQSRLELATLLLSEESLSIDSIARRCGWENGDRFAKIFRRRFGSTPTEFRARLSCQQVSRDLN